MGSVTLALDDIQVAAKRSILSSKNVHTSITGLLSELNFKSLILEEGRYYFLKLPRLNFTKELRVFSQISQ